MKRERLGSRLGFIMLSAGCAIGCGKCGNFLGCVDKTVEVALACVYPLPYYSWNSLFDYGIFCW